MFALGVWFLQTNTPAYAPTPPPLSLEDFAGEIGKEWSEKPIVDQQLFYARKGKWSRLILEKSAEDTIAFESGVQLGVSQKPEMTELTEGPFSVGIPSSHESLRFSISFGATLSPKPRPQWVDVVERSLLYVILIGSALGVICGVVSQVHGEYPAWGVAAELIGATTIGLTLLALWVALIIAAVAAVSLLAILGAVSGVSFDFSF